MRQKLIIIMIIVSMLTGYSAAYASEEEREVINLEKAISLAKANSRELAQYELNRDIAKQRLNQAEYQRDSEWQRYNSLGSAYDALLQNPDATSEDIREAEKNLDSQYEKINTSNSTRSAENNYNDLKKQVDKYLKQLEYEVEQYYTTILNQEESLQTLKRELELKQSQMNIEYAKLQLGSSSRANIDQLTTEITNLNKRLVESTNSLNINKGKLNDILGRDFSDELTLDHFSVPEKADLPESEAFLAQLNREYDALYKLQRDIRQSGDDLDNKSDYYERLLLSMDIKGKELQLEEEKNRLNETANNLISNVLTKQEDYKIALTDFRNVQKSYDWDMKRYEKGQISKLALLQSELNYLSAKDKRLSAGYAFYLAQKSVALAEMGIL
ncbi:TolC family protein [Desulforamulus aquiferis]|uniref:TolC family protein n=1 Tax=Desulforamulus aquiferis TaxID=1397668 RepID=A0AAW7ZAG6_9FIRM|nr:TolC family protein [Desulforamulus aquiferis]MDO7786662.1 TolC family protein [Desulforamulus aquiferis]RYD03362.1 hypothetical protein N752_20110 [Desulforamulus aquiferis]